MKGIKHFYFDLIFFIFICLCVSTVVIYHCYLDISVNYLKYCYLLSGDNENNISNIPHIFGEHIVCQYDPIQQYTTPKEVYDNLPQKEGDFKLFTMNYTNYPYNFYMDPYFFSDAPNTLAIKQSYISTALRMMDHKELYINSHEIPLHMQNNPVYLNYSVTLDNLDKENARLFLKSQKFPYLELDNKTYNNMCLERHIHRPNDFSHKNPYINHLYENNRKIFKLFAAQERTLEQHMRCVMDSLEVIFSHEIPDKENVIKKIIKEVQTMDYKKNNSEEIKDVIMQNLKFDYYKTSNINRDIVSWLDDHNKRGTYVKKNRYTHLCLKYIVDTEHVRQIFLTMEQKQHSISLPHILGLFKEIQGPFFRMIENAIMCKNIPDENTKILDILARNLILAELYNLKICYNYDLMHDYGLYHDLDVENIKSRLAIIFEKHILATLNLQETIYVLKKDVITLVNSINDNMSAFETIAKYKALEAHELKIQMYLDQRKVLFEYNSSELFRVLTILKEDIASFKFNFQQHAQYNAPFPELKSSLWRIYDERGNLGFNKAYEDIGSNVTSGDTSNVNYN